MYKELLKKFNLSIGEVFTYKEREYLVRGDGIFKKIPILTDCTPVTGMVGAINNYSYEYELDRELMVNMIIGKIKMIKQWKPKYEEIYYVPNIQNNALYDNFIWTDDNIDKKFLKRGLVCKTQKEAEELGKKIINYLQHED